MSPAGAALCIAAFAGLMTAGGSALAAADEAAALQRGEQLYQRCVACHAVETNRTGPQHCGLFGRKAGTAPGYTTYSQALRDTRIVWDAKTLDMFLRDPMTAVPGTAMGYSGVKDPKERADLIAWLREATRPGKSCKLAR